VKKMAIFFSVIMYEKFENINFVLAKKNQCRCLLIEIFPGFWSIHFLFRIGNYFYDKVVA